jgi:hypothetical protein
MDDPQRQIDAARQQEQVLTQQLAQLKQEEETLLDLETYLRVISYAYQLIVRYQDGNVRGYNGIVLNQAVC